ncbi:hypothetical protein Mal64_35070 [Pseudobythopirellula maris]|uniref:Helix-turn-helix domain protein n=1 Tax=Pseudobythopirellula maris TaxID=2527991 RepID=A0A5C5ZHN0_9BACT|nr:hypothetical protein Mal64_35070 [Pseudobythopirellula maris]
MPTLFTLGDIARALGIDKDRVRYIIESRQIEPVGRAAHFRLFDEDGRNAVSAAEKAMTAQREAVAP